MQGRGFRGPKRPLFFFDDEDDSLTRVERQALALVEVAPDDEILDRDIELFVASVMANFQVDPVRLGEPVQDPPTDCSVEVSGFDYILRPGETKIVPGRLYRIRYPATGYLPLLNRRPNPYFPSFPHGYLDGGDVIFEYRMPGFDHGETLKREHKGNFDLFMKFLENANKNLEDFMGRNLPERIQSALKHRQERITKSRESAAALGIPIVRKENHRTAASPIIEVRDIIKKPGTRDPNDPVPMREFEGILGVIEAAGKHWERHPRMAAGWDETQFRDGLILYLNLAYRKTGSVTGETFIKGGKSDILIREQDVDVFVSECKIWGGQARIHNDLDQLFERYLTWRTTKAALIYFHRGKNTSDVVEHIKREVSLHPSHIDTLPQIGPTHLRFKCDHPSDRKRIFDFAVLVIPVST